VEGVYERVGFSKKEAADMVEMIFDLMKEVLERGEKIKVSGFGNFVVKEKRARKGRNPQTGERINIPVSKAPAFVPGINLKKAIKQK
jgi:integration host factor subunit alpha